MRKKFFTAKINKKFDIQKLSAKFPTEAQAEKQRKKYIRILQQSNKPKDRDLGKWMQLLRCRRKEYCGQAICPVCMRLYQRWYVAQLIRITRKHPDAKFITPVIGDRYVNSKKLLKLSIKTLKNRLTTQIRRSGMEYVIVVGGFEFDRDYDLGCWVPHFHLLVIGSTKESRKNLRRFYADTPHTRMIKISDWDGSVQLLSYLLKSYSKRRKKYLGQTRLNKKELIAELHFRSRYQCHQFAFLRGVKRVGNRIVFVNQQPKSVL